MHGDRKMTSAAQPRRRRALWGSSYIREIADDDCYPTAERLADSGCPGGPKELGMYEGMKEVFDL